MTDRRADDPTVAVRLRPELVARLDDACRTRVVSRRFVIEAALERLLDSLPPLPDTFQEDPHG